MGAVFGLGKFYGFIPSLKQQIGFVERQLASDTYSGKAGVSLPNALAVIRFGIYCYGVTAPGHGYMGTKVGVRLSPVRLSPDIWVLKWVSV